ncbi:uncharacterized protein BJ171DRAFT_149908 [Polychytrium aggregatum]|uniref:uncharacterized protein n=1 Tax=Polychytrium aggregatum TaxID=110093 RepID=UPI0022FEB141|nr:uncharacterized protein BJ171DRAFT_149908 [Polychytrium aggregatum]KAI9203322.1 hypothetical protein BJ171DRAFT_149908 [Polychytrium aggregatum]
MSFISSIFGGSKTSLQSRPGEPDEGEERYFGLENYGNTCYCNSVLQALYFCKPFRDCLQHYSYPRSAAFLAATYEGIPLKAQGSTPTAGISPLPPASSTSPSGTALPAAPSGPKPNSTGNVIQTILKPSSGGAKLIKAKSKSAKSLWGNKTDVEIEAAPSQSSQATPEPELDLEHEPPTMLPVSLENILDTPMENQTASLMTSLQDMFLKIRSQKKRTGVFGPKEFIQTLKSENELFRGAQQQDAQEFLNYLLNAIAEILVKQQKEYIRKIRSEYERVNRDMQSRLATTGSGSAEDQPKDNVEPNQPASWVHAIFEGVLTNETKCLTCETVTNRDEAFLDLSVDIEQHSSVSSCLRNFSSSETLCHKNKFFCDTCGSLQEAEKRMKIKRPPNVLAIHLKRFKYQERVQRYVKLCHRVSFPLELRLFNMVDDVDDVSRLYSLSAVIVHLGSGPYHGHYIALVKSNSRWLCFDDEHVTVVEPHELNKYFGDHTSQGTGYIFFYESFSSTDAMQLVRAMGTKTEEAPAANGLQHITSESEPNLAVHANHNDAESISSSNTGGTKNNDSTSVTGSSGHGQGAAGAANTKATQLAEQDKKRRNRNKRPSLPQLSPSHAPQSSVHNPPDEDPYPLPAYRSNTIPASAPASAHPNKDEGFKLPDPPSLQPSSELKEKEGWNWPFGRKGKAT